jgi:maltokinase
VRDHAADHLGVVRPPPEPAGLTAGQASVLPFPALHSLAVDGPVASELRGAREAAWSAAHLGPGASEVRLRDLIALSTGWLAIGELDGDVLVAPIVRKDATLRRARAGDGVIAELVAGAAAIRIPELRGSVVHTEITRGVERAVAVDQSNESTVLDEAVVVKLFPRTRPGSHPGAELPEHLAAVGFRDVPSPLGSLRWGDTVIATLARFLPGARDGWDWFVGLVLDACDGTGTWEAPDRSAAAIGDLVARMHRALATPSAIIPAPVGQAHEEEIASWRARADATLDEAIGLIDGPEGGRLRALEGPARSVLASLDAVTASPTMPVHGDLHVGQILRTPDGSLAVNDFDGDPVAAASARAAVDAPARDVAAMAAAMDHVGRVATRYRPKARSAIDPWIEGARRAFLDAYRSGLGDRVDLFDERLLAPFSVAQEAHEFVYAARFQRRWRSVPDVAMPAALRRAGVIA